MTPTDRGTLQTLTGLLRGHLQLIVPEVEQAAARLPTDDIPPLLRARLCRRGPREAERSPWSDVLRRCRVCAQTRPSLLALCDHYETSTSTRMSLACDQPIREGEVSRRYGEASCSGGTSFSGRIHDHCVNTVRIG